MNKKISFLFHANMHKVLGYEDWNYNVDYIYELVSESIIPFFEVISDLMDEGIKPYVNFALNPMIICQFESKQFKHGFKIYLEKKIKDAENDITYFSMMELDEKKEIASYWKEFYKKTQEHFIEIYNEDLIGFIKKLYQENIIECLAMPASHALMNFFSQDIFIKAQIQEGIKEFKRIFQKEPKGFFIPKLSYMFPGDNFYLIDDILTGEGIEYVVCDPKRSYIKPEDSGLRFINVNLDLLDKIESDEDDKEGYLYDTIYLDSSHRKLPSELKYWQNSFKTSEFELYSPRLIDNVLKNNASDFVNNIDVFFTKAGKDENSLCIPIDLSLIGIHWFEGSRFCYHVFENINNSKNVDMAVLNSLSGIDKVDKNLQIDSSWEDYYWNDDNMWVWEFERSFEKKFCEILKEIKERNDINEEQNKVLKILAKEMLMFQNLDWYYLIDSPLSEMYAENRVREFINKIRNLFRIIENLLQARELSKQDNKVIEYCNSNKDFCPGIEPLEWM